MAKDIKLKSVGELLGMNFFIPGYQRGYRWTKQQVNDLLNDIQDYIINGNNGIYCIQPLVVKEQHQDTLAKIKNACSVEEVKRLLLGTWEVIDGQQRLTTIKILLSYLKGQSYFIEYETRSKSKDYLESKLYINNEELSENIDFFHMHKAYITINEWFDGKTEEEKRFYLETLNACVKFIWYETDETDPIKVFTRLNIGKIPLTDSELIKALFLNESNFEGQNYETIRMQQIEIANEWDKIEYTMQNDEFWLFIQNDIHYKKSTKIDYIFDLIREDDTLSKFRDESHTVDSTKDLVAEKHKEEIGFDEHKTFRYFYFYFQQNKNRIDAEWLRNIWCVIKNYFQIFEEWYNDLELYHYIGFLVERGERIVSLIKLYTGDKDQFKIYVKKKIGNKLIGCDNLLQEYEKGKPKSACYPLLLLYNVQTIITQNKNIVINKYGMPIFYKFPFHIFKKEKWDMEHIDSNTDNPLTKSKEQEEWLKDCMSEIDDENIRNEINEFIKRTADDKVEFFEIVEKIERYLDKGLERLHEAQTEGEINQKNLLWNYCLLDSNTNRSYGNAIFPVKRRRIIQKDKGEYGVSFVPPCTKNVFLKYYSQKTNVLRAWEKSDAVSYLLDINKVLSSSGFIQDQENEILKLL